jgi:hypothetical protein
MKKSKLINAASRSMAIAGFCLLFSIIASAQAAPDAPVYLLREYMKVEPGMDEEYLKVEQLWKKVHQRRKDEGKILNWNLSRRSFYGTHADYDYMTVTAFKSGKELEEAQNMTWEYITKGMTADEIALANTTGKTRKMVSSSLSYQLLKSQSPAENRFIKITQAKAAPGKGAELEKAEALMKPVFDEAGKMGAISGWRFGRHLYPRSAESANYYRIESAATMDQMLTHESNGYLEKAFKKIYPAKDFAATMKSVRDMITLLDVELLERVDSTK